MKIVIISNQAASLINFRGPLLEELIKRGHEVLAFAPDHDEASRKSLSKMGVKYIDYKLNRSGTSFFKEIESILLLRRLLKHHKPDLCFSYFIKPVIYGTIAAWMAGINKRFGMIEGLGFAFTQATSHKIRRNITQKIIILMARVAMLGINRLILLNIDDINELTEKRVIPHEKTALLGAIGLDLNDWKQSQLPNGHLVFILVARLLKDKGIYEYITAARIIKKTNPEVHFILLGGLDDNPAAIKQSEIESWIDEGLIEWPGHVAVKPWLQKSHIFVLPSYYREGLPRSTQEAMALGRPIITTDVPGCKETVIEGQNGFIIPAKKPDDLAIAMQRFIDDPSIIATMGQKSREIAEVKFDVHIQNSKLLNILGL